MIWQIVSKRRNDLSNENDCICQIKKNFPKNTHYSEANFHKCSNPVNCSCESGADYHEICTVTALVINNVMYNRPPTPVR